MRFLGKIRERRIARQINAMIDAEEDRIFDELIRSSDTNKLSKHLPVNYDSWHEFWQDAKGCEYITVPVMEVGEYGMFQIVMDENNNPIPLTYHRGHIEEKAIEEAIAKEDYETAKNIKGG